MFFIAITLFLLSLAPSKFQVNCCFHMFKSESKTGGYIYTVPSSGPFLGTYSIQVQGTSFSKNDKVLLSFENNNNVSCTYQNQQSVVCPVPQLNQLGQIRIRLFKNSYKYYGYFQAINNYVTKPTVLERLDYYYLPKSTNLELNWNFPDKQLQSESVLSSIVYTSDLNGKITVYEKKLSNDISYTNSLNVDLGIILPENSNKFNIYDTNIGAVIFMIKNKNSNTIIDWVKIGIFTLNNQSSASDTCLASTDNRTKDAVAELAKEIPCPKKIFKEDDYWKSFVEAFKNDEACNLKNKTVPCRIFPGASWCYRSVHGTTNNYGQQCCYNSTADLILGFPGGTTDITHQSTVEGIFGHFRGDVFHYITCCQLSQNCWKYYVLRPSVSGENWNPYNTAGCYGAFHLMTFDDYNYTLQTPGEYDLLKIASINLNVQGRLSSLKSVNVVDKPIVLKAVEIQEGSSGVLKFEVDVNGNLIVKHENIILSFSDSDYYYYSSFLVSKTNNTYSIQLRSGILIEIKYGFKMNNLNLKASLPVKFKKQVSGLFGNWDGISENDISGTSGSFSLKRKKKNDPFSEALIASDIGSLCENNKECFYDFAVTGDILFAQFGLQIAKEIQNEKNWYKKYVSQI